MAGKLIQVATETVTSAVASVTLTGIDSDDVYMVTIVGASPSNGSDEIRIRVTKDVAGTPTPQTTANYDWADKFLRASAAFINDYGANGTYTRGTGNIDNAFQGGNGIFYLYNFNNSSEYSFITIESVTYGFSEGRGYQGGTVYTVAEAHNGIHFYPSTGNIDSGTFTLYKVV